MATMNAAEVTVGSAKSTGAIYTAATTTALPTDATTALSGYTLLGYTSEDGVTISESTSSEAIRAWEGRAEVYNVITEYTESVSFTPIQCNADVAKLTWGDDAVTVDSQTGAITCNHSGATLEPVHIVIETAPREGIVKRYCMKAQLTERGEITMDGTQVDGRQLTFNALADNSGVTMVEYTAFTS